MKKKYYRGSCHWWWTRCRSYTTWYWSCNFFGGNRVKACDGSPWSIWHITFNMRIICITHILASLIYIYVMGVYKKKTLYIIKFLWSHNQTGRISPIMNRNISSLSPVMTRLSELDSDSLFIIHVEHSLFLLWWYGIQIRYWCTYRTSCDMIHLLKLVQLY